MRSSTVRAISTWWAMNAVPRSNDSVDMATLQPSLMSPTTFSSGMRTSS